MPDYNPNQFVRAFAVLALVVALIAVAAVIVTTSGGSNNGNGSSAKTKSKAPSKRGRQAIHRGVWIVRPGDTLGKISEETGVDVATLTQLNPDLDPQALLEGQRIAVR
jgi:LysM repeat protein